MILSIVLFTFIYCLIQGIRGLAKSQREHKERIHREQQRARRKKERENNTNLKEYYNSDTLNEDELKALFNREELTQQPKVKSFYSNSLEDFLKDDREIYIPEGYKDPEEVVEKAVDCILDSEEFQDEVMYKFRKKHGLLSVEELRAGKNLPMSERNTAPIVPRKVVHEEVIVPLKKADLVVIVGNKVG